MKHTDKNTKIRYQNGKVLGDADHFDVIESVVSNEISPTSMSLRQSKSIWMIWKYYDRSLYFISGVAFCKDCGWSSHNIDDEGIGSAFGKRSALWLHCRTYAIHRLGHSLWNFPQHYIDVIMTTMASQITSLTVVYLTVYSDADQRNIKAPRHLPLCGEFTGTGEFPAQMASYAENVSIWWRHHGSKQQDLSDD